MRDYQSLSKAPGIAFSVRGGRFGREERRLKGRGRPERLEVPVASKLSLSPSPRPVPPLDVDDVGTLRRFLALVIRDRGFHSSVINCGALTSRISWIFRVR